MLNAAVVVANHPCLRHQPSFFSSRRLRRISRANAVLRGLNSLGSRLLRSSIVVNLARLSVGSAARARRSRAMTGPDSSALRYKLSIAFLASLPASVRRSRRDPEEETTRRTIKSVVMLMMSSQRRREQSPVWGVHERKGMVRRAK